MKSKFQISNLKCSVEGCKRKMYSIKHRICHAHLNRYYAKGDVGPAKIYTYRIRKPYIKE